MRPRISNVSSSVAPLVPVPRCVYEIDARDRLAHCNEQWNRAAADYEAPRNAFDRVRGSVVWGAIGDPVTEGLHRAMVGLARDGRTTSFPFRCDTAGERRDFDVTVGPGEGGR